MWVCENLVSLLYRVCEIWSFLLWARRTALIGKNSSFDKSRLFMLNWVWTVKSVQLYEFVLPLMQRTLFDPCNQFAPPKVLKLRLCNGGFVVILDIVENHRQVPSMRYNWDRRDPQNLDFVAVDRVLKPWIHHLEWVKVLPFHVKIVTEFFAECFTFSR